MTEFYKVGQATVENGSVRVWSSGLAIWLPTDVKAGNTFEAGDQPPRSIATDAVWDDDAELYYFDLVLPWQGSDGTFDYSITKTSSDFGTNRGLALLIAEAIRIAATTTITEEQLNNAVTDSGANADAAAAALANLLGHYYGPLADDPAADPNGDPIDDGDVFFHTGTGKLRIHETSGWTDMLEGQKGDQGIGAGFQWALDTTTSDGDPGAGKFRLNASDHALADTAWLDDTDENGASPGAAVMGWADVTTADLKGLLLVTKAASRAVFRLYRVAGAPIDKTGYREVPLAYVGGSGTISNTDVCEVVFNPAGEKGTTGAPGVTAGTAFTFSTTITDADPGDGAVRFSSATFGAVAAIYFDNLDAGGNAVTGWLDSFDNVANAGSRGSLRLQQADDPAVFAHFHVTGVVTDGGGYRKVAVTPIDGVVPAAGTALVANFTPAGADGTAGLDGAQAGVGFNFETATSNGIGASGGLRANNGTLTSATALYISKNNRAGNTIAAWLATFDDSTNPTVKGQLYITKPATGDQFVCNVTGITDHTGYVEVAVADGTGATGFSAADILAVLFQRTSDRGASGSGAGDVVGPGSSVSGNLPVFSNTSGDGLADSGKAVADLLQSANNLSDVDSPIAAIDNLSVTGSDIASAATLDLDSATGDTVKVTGTTGVTAVTLGDGKKRWARFAAAVTIAVGSSLILTNGGSNYTTAADDWIEFHGAAAGKVYGIIHRASGSAGGIPTGWVDTDTSLGANSDSKIATQKAVKAYADAGYRPGGTDVAVADGGTGASTQGGARTNLGLGTISTQDASAVAITGGTAAGLTQLQLISTDAGATVNPILDGFRDSASPAAADVLMGIQWNGRDNAGNKQLYAQVDTVILSPTSTSESAALYMRVAAGGTLNDSAYFTGSGLVPATNSGSVSRDLGDTSNGWSTLYMSTSGTIRTATNSFSMGISSGVMQVNIGELRIGTAGTHVQSVTVNGGTQTLTNKTLTSPTINSPTMTSPVLGAATGTSLALSGSGLAPLSLISTDDTATTVAETRFRNSATPAASDVLWTLNFDGNDAGGTQRTYAAAVATLLQPNSGSAFGQLALKVRGNNGVTVNSFDGVVIAGNNGDSVTVALNGVTSVRGNLTPAANGVGALGTTSLSWGGARLSSGSTLNWANGDWVATHSTGLLTVGTGDLQITTVGTTSTSVVTVGGTQTLTNKTLTSPTINAGTATALTGLSIRSTGAAFNLTLASSEVLTAGRTLSIVMGNAARTLTLSGSPTLGDWFDQPVKQADTPTFAGLSSTGTVNIGPFSATGATNGKQMTTTLFDISRDATSTTNPVRFYNPNGQVGSISLSGSTTAFNTSSDARLKANLRDFDSGELVDAMTFYRYDWKRGGSGYGPMAQELDEVFPDAVTRGDNGDEVVDPWSYDASKLVPVAMHELKVLRRRVALLEAA